MPWWKPQHTETLVIHFRSGASIRLDKISNWEVSNRDGKIIGITLAWHKSVRRRLIVKSLMFSEVVAITVEKD